MRSQTRPLKAEADSTMDRRLSGVRARGPLLLLLPVLLLSVLHVRALDNGLMLLPPMGWNTWCAFGPCGTDVCTERQVLDSIAAMKSNGMATAGYEWITLDDCYAMRRDNATGELFPDPALFPNGFDRVVAAAHAANFKFGIYTSAGNYTCHAKKENCSGTCNVGSLGHYEQDAATFARWQLDYVKMDWCSASVRALDCRTQYALMARALNRTGRPMALYMSCGGHDSTEAWPPTVSNVWRIGFDHLDCWTDGPCTAQDRSKGHGTKQAIAYLAGRGAQQAPGGWGTPDFLKTGGKSCAVNATPGPGALCPTQTAEEYRTELTMWSMASAPLLVSSDIRALTPLQRELLLNREVLGIDQQPVGGDCSGAPGRHCGRDTGGVQQVWTKPLAETAFAATRGWGALRNHTAVALVNLGDTAAEPIAAANLTQILGLAGGAGSGGAGGGAVRVRVRDVWRQAECPGPDCPATLRLACDAARDCTLTDTVPAHGTRLFRVWLG